MQDDGDTVDQVFVLFVAFNETCANGASQCKECPRHGSNCPERAAALFAYMLSRIPQDIATFI